MISSNIPAMPLSSTRGSSTTSGLSLHSATFRAIGIEFFALFLVREHLGRQARLVHNAAHHTARERGGYLFYVLGALQKPRIYLVGGERGYAHLARHFEHLGLAAPYASYKCDVHYII